MMLFALNEQIITPYYQENYLKSEKLETNFSMGNFEYCMLDERNRQSMSFKEVRKTP